MVNEQLNLNLAGMAGLIQELRERATSLKEQGDIPAVVKNCERILASIYMLEININDVLSVLQEDGRQEDGRQDGRPAA